MQEIIENIRYNKGGKFPQQELLKLIDNEEEATPYLLSILEDLTRDSAEFLKEPTRMDHIYALYLLAQFREQRLFPLLISVLRLPTEELNLLLDDVITEGSGRMLASVYAGDLPAIQQLVEDEGLDEFVRGQGLHAIAMLALHERLERDFATGYFRQLLAQCHEDYPNFNAHIVCSLVDLHAVEAYAEIEQAFEEDKIDEMMLNMEYVREEFESTQETVLLKRRTEGQYSFIEDTVGEMQWWACFEQEKKKLPQPAVKAAKVGRNDPCPCGSGKKYKKCCGKG